MSAPRADHAHLMTRTVADLVKRPDPRRAAALAAGLGAAPETLPEAAMLLAVPGLTAAQRRAMTARMIPSALSLDDSALDALAGVMARIAAAGFSFPCWRFTAQGYGGPSLMEQFGMQRRQRPADRYDADGPASPQNDRYGTGFVLHDENGTVELRRAYILCADRRAGEQAVLVIRNNSWFFGRDRLPGAFHAGWEAIGPARLEALEDSDFRPGVLLQPWPAALADDDGPPPAEKIRRLGGLVRRLDAVLAGMDEWMRGPAGMACLAQAIDRAVAQQAAQGRDAPPFYLAAIAAGAPPWAPHGAVPVTAGAARALRAAAPAQEAALAPLFNALARPGMRLQLLSGPHGDFPLPSPAAGPPKPGI